MVSQVLEQVSAGLDWETIVEEWRGSVTTEAIAEAVHLASQGCFVSSKLTPDNILDLAAQVYAGLSKQEIADVERIALDRSNFAAARSSEG